MTPLEVLHTYFQYDTFRPFQEEVIESVLSGQDTLAIMPTGGGKSLCFQVPTLVQPDPSKRLTLVITPLIALMKDQVMHLTERDIGACALYTGQNYAEQQRLINNCRYSEQYHFLYLSPERLSTDTFHDLLPSLPVGLIVVDEAHCISQWGYDFRPSYLQIAQARNLLRTPVPLLALTATADETIAEDICTQLHFSEPHHILRMPCERENIHYSTVEISDKAQYLLSRLQELTNECVIVYVRSRNTTRDLCRWLQEQGINCDYYHAGLNSIERSERQCRWQSGEVPVIICTNAFGMGIDKPDVRYVFHYDLPDDLTAYYQETGRAGRDGHPSEAITLYSPKDATYIRQRVNKSFPTKAFVGEIYDMLCDYYQIGIDSGQNHAFNFNLFDFCKVMHVPAMETRSALLLLTYAQYIIYDENPFSSPRVLFTIKRDDLYYVHFSVLEDRIVNALLRTCAGIFTQPQYVNEQDLTTDCECSLPVLTKTLIDLSRRHILKYIPRSHEPRVTFCHEREETIFLPVGVYEKRRDKFVTALDELLKKVVPTYSS